MMNTVLIQLPEDFEEKYRRLISFYGSKHEFDEIRDNWDKYCDEDKRRITAITTASYHKLSRDQWFRTRGILNKIASKLAPLGGKDQEVSIDESELRPEEKPFLEPTLTHALKMGVIGTERSHPPKEVTILSSETIRKLFRGEVIIVHDFHEFSKYHQNISNLAEYIEQDGKERFPEFYGISKNEITPGERDRDWQESLAIKKQFEYGGGIEERASEIALNKIINREAEDRSDRELIRNPEFDIKQEMIIINNKECKLPIGSNQLVLCKALFVNPTEWVREDDVVDNFYRGKKSPQSFYDAVRQINIKVEKELGIPNLIEYRASNARLRPALFEL